MPHETRVLVELTEREVKEILGTAVKQMVQIAQEPSSSEQDVETLASVINKCSKATKSIRSSKSLPKSYNPATMDKTTY